MESTPSDARENGSAANRNTNATALQVIIDSSWYKEKHRSSSGCYEVDWTGSTC